MKPCKTLFSIFPLICHIVSSFIHLSLSSFQCHRPFIIRTKIKFVKRDFSNLTFYNFLTLFKAFANLCKASVVFLMRRHLLKVFFAKLIWQDSNLFLGLHLWHRLGPSHSFKLLQPLRLVLRRVLLQPVKLEMQKLQMIKNKQRQQEWAILKQIDSFALK